MEIKFTIVIVYRHIGECKFQCFDVSICASINHRNGFKCMFPHWECSEISIS